MQTLNVEDIIKGLSQYSFPINLISKQNLAMRRGMKKTCALTVRCYAESLIYLNEYLVSFPGADLNDKIVVTELKTSSPTVCLIAGLNRPIYKSLIVSLSRLKKLLICLSVWKFPSLFTKV